MRYGDFREFKMRMHFYFKKWQIMVTIKELEELARHATQVIVNTWQYEQHRQRAELLRSLVSVGQTINRNLHVDEVLESVTREAAGLDRVKMCSLQLLDPSGEWLEVRAQFGADRVPAD